MLDLDREKKVENSVILYVVYFLFDKNIVVECFVPNLRKILKISPNTNQSEVFLCTVRCELSSQK